MEHWSLEQYKNYKEKKSKYGNEEVVSDGIKFDSKKEEQRWQELKILEKGKAIKDLRRQVRFELQPSYKKNGKTIRGIYYVADFVYYSFTERKTIVEDVKSEATKTQVYKLKKKLFEYKYKNLEIKEV